MKKLRQQLDEKKICEGRVEGMPREDNTKKENARNYGGQEGGRRKGRAVTEEAIREKHNQMERGGGYVVTELRSGLSFGGGRYLDTDVFADPRKIFAPGFFLW